MFLLKKVIVYLLLCSLSLTSVSFANNSIYVVKDTELEDLIKTIIKPIFKVAGVNSNSINIYIVNDNSLNAFVAGGQNIFVNTGLISSAESYEEIAGVLAHELAHITAGHLPRGTQTYENLNKMFIISFATLATLFFTVAATSSNSSNNNATDILGFLLFSTSQSLQSKALQYSRSEESQADQIAMEYLKQTETDMGGFYSFMDKLYQQEDKNINQDIYAWYSTHPLTSNRLSFINQYIKNNKQTKVFKNKELEQSLKRSKAKIFAYTHSYQDTKKKYGKANDLESIYAMAIAELLQENFDASLKYLSKIPLKDNDIYTLELIADVYFKKTNYKNAIIYYEKALEKESNENEILYFNIAKSYFLTNNFNKALKNINVSLQINSNNPSAWAIKANIYNHQGKESLAQLATAERFLVLKDIQKAHYFAKKSLAGLKKNTKEWEKALLIINQKK